MKDFLKRVKADFLLSSIMCILLGVVFIIWKESVLDVIGSILAFGLILIGVVYLCSFFLKMVTNGFSVVMGIIVITENNTTEEIVIPNDAIRIRVIAPSDSIEDQKLKGNVKRSIQGQLSEMLKDVKTIDQAREVLNKNLSDVEYTVKTELKRNNSNINFNVNYGLNYFPIKEYKGITYDDGYYESLVITLGQGQGKNWWCVLFPPLCLMDEEEENMENVEYKSFIKEVLDKYF